MSTPADSNGSSNREGQNGRDGNGRFTKGCAPGPGNPNAAAVSRLRAEFFKSLKSSDITLALTTIRNVLGDKNAKDSDRLKAAEILFERALGKPLEHDVLEQISQLEDKVAEMIGRRGRVA